MILKAYRVPLENALLRLFPRVLVHIIAWYSYPSVEDAITIFGVNKQRYLRNGMLCHGRHPDFCYVITHIKSH